MDNTEPIFEKYWQRLATYSITTPRRKAMFMANIEYEYNRPFHARHEGRYGLLKTLWLKIRYDYRLCELIGLPVKISNTTCDFQYNNLGMLKLEEKVLSRFSIHYTVRKDEPINSEYNAITLSSLYWNYLSLNRYADRGDILGCTLRLTGCLRGLKQRAELYKKWLIFFEQTNLN